MPTHDENAPRISPQIVGNAGLYYVCHRLSLLGWNCMPTSRNARGVDLICYNADCSRMGCRHPHAVAAGHAGH